MRKTIFGVVLAVFLLMSVSFIAPIQVQAVETSDIKSGLRNLINNMQDYKDDLESLVTDDELQEIIADMLDEDDQEKLLSLGEDYKTALEKNDVFNTLTTQFAADNQDDIENLQSNIDDILDVITEKSSNSATNYKIDMNGLVFSITKQTSQDVSEGEILITSDGLLKIPYKDADKGIDTVIDIDIPQIVLILTVIALAFAGVLVGFLLVKFLFSTIAGVLTGIVMTISDAIASLSGLVDFSKILGVLSQINLFLIIIVVVIIAAIVVLSIIHTYSDAIQGFINDVEAELNKLLEKISEEEKEESEQGKYKSFLSLVEAMFREMLKKVLVFIGLQNLFA